MNDWQIRVVHVSLTRLWSISTSRRVNKHSPTDPRTSYQVTNKIVRVIPSFTDERTTFRHLYTTLPPRPTDAFHSLTQATWSHGKLKSDLVLFLFYWHIENWFFVFFFSPLVFLCYTAPAWFSFSSYFSKKVANVPISFLVYVFTRINTSLPYRKMTRNYLHR
jgi:hypothetical protein